MYSDNHFQMTSSLYRIL